MGVRSISEAGCVACVFVCVLDSSIHSGTALLLVGTHANPFNLNLLLFIGLSLFLENRVALSSLG